MYNPEFFISSETKAIKINPPQLFWEYGVIADLQSKVPLPPELVKELKRFIPEIELKIWPKKGEPLIQSIIEHLKKGFINNHPTINCVLNPKIRTMSYPLIFNAKDYIALFPQTPKYGQEDLIYEICVLLLFRYLEENFAKLDNKSALIEKYHKEGAGVTNRLFPFALIQFTYIENNLIEELDAIKNNCTSPAVIRAWEIIEKEGIKPFLNELRDYELELKDNQQFKNGQLEV